MALPANVVVLGHPQGRRVPLFQAALARCGRPPAQVIAYRDLLDGTDQVERALRPGCLVRLDSPEQDFEVEKRLIALGAEEPETEDMRASWIDAASALKMTYDRGRLRFPRQWYRGFRALLRRVAHAVAACPGARFLNPPADVVTMFDKRACQERFAAAGVPVPARPGPARSFAELLHVLRTAGCARAFVKLAHGSSASGVVALTVSPTRMQAVTTVEMVRDGDEWRLYNARRIRTYTTIAEIEALLDVLCREGVQVEAWVPKAGFDGHAFDLRILVVAGRTQHIVPRLSRTPMTNLHLLNPRGDLEQVQARIPPNSWQAAMRSACRAAAQFPASHYAGVDLLFTPGFRSHAVLEINAFGDLLPGAVCAGQDTYDAELAALAETTS